MSTTNFSKVSVKLVAFVLICGIFNLGGCIKHTTKVTPPPTFTSAKTATAEQLLETIARLSEVRSLQSPSLVVDAEGGAVEEGKIEKYRSVPGYLFLERPQNIRLSILAPVAKNTLFDMASNGATFQIWYPRENKFFVGNNNAIKIKNPELAKNPLSKFRPQHLSNALLMESISSREPEENYFIYEDQDNAAKYYIVGVVGTKKGSRTQLLRRIWIERSKLQVVRQQYYEENGSVLSDIRYSNYQSVGNSVFPSVIRIERPNDKYAITLKFKELKLNETLSADIFTLSKPPTAELVQIKS